MRLLSLIFLFLPFLGFAADAPLKVPENLPEEFRRVLEAPEENPPPSADSLYLEFFKMIIMLGAIIGLLLLSMWFVKRMMNARIEQMNVSSFIKVIERRSLSAKTSLYVIELQDRRIAIAESHNGITVLGNISAPSRSSINEL